MIFKATKHYEMWDWLARHADMIIDIYEMGNYTSDRVLYYMKNIYSFYYDRELIDSSCYACRYAWHYAREGVCRYCPLLMERCRTGYYSQLLRSIENLDIKGIKDACIKIRDAKIKEGVVFE